ncbi:hypothetical protein HAX54_012007 [Datura stramonium]|uniref:Putative plant transposon protein domain-containing protein n=1 Tax=Datura stramonium TaxID=4076 RepID=A0ABS8TKZ4_DATST|nr:hypothetical protein [Datura stramonium]
MVQENQIALAKLDMSHFISPEAAKWARKKIRPPFVEERGLALAPKDAVPTLVREFYANMDVEMLTSTIWGDTIYFSPEIINKMYATADVDDDQLKVLLNDGVFEIVAAPLYPNGINWHVDVRGNRVWFASRNLSLPAKVWMLFVNARLVPNRNTSEVRAPRAAWLYAIEHRYSINVERIICKNMKRCRTFPSVKSFFHSSTITKLIRLYGKQPPIDMGYRHTSDIGIGTLRSLGPCVGPTNEQAQGRRAPNSAHLLRIEDKIDNLAMIQQQMHEDIAFIRTTVLSSIVNLMWNIENTPNIFTVFSPHVYQNIGFPFGNAGLQEQQPTDANQYS